MHPKIMLLFVPVLATIMGALFLLLNTIALLMGTGLVAVAIMGCIVGIVLLILGIRTIKRALGSLSS